MFKNTTQNKKNNLYVIQSNNAGNISDTKLNNKVKNNDYETIRKTVENNENNNIKISDKSSKNKNLKIILKLINFFSINNIYINVN